MNLNTIGEILRFYREKYNFKQSDVCNGICSISTLSRIENGNKAADSLYGAEGTHWSRAAETVLDKTYEEGTFHFLENLEKAGTLYTKNHIDPMLSLASFADILNCIPLQRIRKRP